MWNELLANLAIVALASSVWTAILGSIGRYSLRWQQVALGSLMGLATLLSMLLPFQFTKGVFLDLRYALIALSAFFGGPVAAVIPVIVACVRRIMLGGTGIWVAIPNIAFAFGFGSFGYFVKREAASSMATLALLAVAVVLSGTMGFFAMVPTERWGSMVANVVAPFGSILFLSTFLSGLAISQEIRRQAVLKENWTYRAVIDALPDSLHAKDLDGKLIAANPATAKLMAVANVDALMGRTAASFCTPETAEMIKAKESAVNRSGIAESFEEEVVRSDGERLWLSTLKVPFRNSNGEIVGIITHNREITDRKRLELELAEAQIHLTDALSSMADGLALFDSAGNLVFTNTRYLEMFPLTADVMVPGNSITAIISTSLERNEIVEPNESEETVGRIVAQLTAKSASREILMSDGRWLQARTRWTRNGGSMVMFSDVTKAKQDENDLRELNQKLFSLAQTDGLTGLTNRRAFDRVLEVAIDEARAINGDVGLLMIDVDKFKIFNDTYGHPAGDRCLRLVADCLVHVVSPFSSATVGRYGGEEFGIVLPKMNLSEAESVGRLVMSAVRSLGSAEDGDPLADVTVSVGVASIASSLGKSPNRILDRADSALYRAKAAGRDCIRVANAMDGTAGWNGAIR